MLSIDQDQMILAYDFIGFFKKPDFVLLFTVLNEIANVSFNIYVLLSKDQCFEMRN